jgi:hypothetical protein
MKIDESTGWQPILLTPLVIGRQPKTTLDLSMIGTQSDNAQAPVKLLPEI